MKLVHRSMLFLFRKWWHGAIAKEQRHGQPSLFYTSARVDKPTCDAPATGKSRGVGVGVGEGEEEEDKKIRGCGIHSARSLSSEHNNASKLYFVCIHSQSQIFKILQILKFSVIMFLQARLFSACSG